MKTVTVLQKDILIVIAKAFIGGIQSSKSADINKLVSHASEKNVTPVKFRSNTSSLERKGYLLIWKQSGFLFISLTKKGFKLATETMAERQHLFVQREARNYSEILSFGSSLLPQDNSVRRQADALLKSLKGPDDTLIDALLLTIVKCLKEDRSDKHPALYPDLLKFYAPLFADLLPLVNAKKDEYKNRIQPAHVLGMTAF